MRLWTYHSPDFSLLDGVYDPEKSEWYRSNSRYAAAYHGLWQRVGLRNLVWCSPSENNTWRGRREWVLEVPETRFLKIVDSMVWNGILGNDIGPPGRLRDSLLSEAMLNDAADPYGWPNRKVQGMLHPHGDPWASLFLADPTIQERTFSWNTL